MKHCWVKCTLPDLPTGYTYMQGLIKVYETLAEI